MNNPTAQEIITIHLKQNGYDGLCTDDCGCLIDDLAPCGSIGLNCKAGYKAVGVDGVYILTEKID